MTPRHPFALALVLSLAAALSLGMARFAYALLLPPMRADLHWSYLLAGAMNTANALGYLLGALAAPAMLRHWSAGRAVLAGAAATSVFMLLSGFSTATAPLMALRLGAGVGSALVFIGGGVLAARLASAFPARAGFLLALFYGGTGFGIVLSAVAVPWASEAAQGWAAHHGAWGWQAAWLVLGAACGLITLALRWPVRVLHSTATSAAAGGGRFPAAAFSAALLAYVMFGMGYIGYMTFVVALLRERGLAAAQITLFYALLGVGVVLSSGLWSGLLQRHRSGRPMAILHALLALACAVPALSSALPAVLLSGAAFGAVFLQIPGATTALVRHNLPAPAWTAGISAFTAVFALGQVVGPTLVGYLSDAMGGLARGLLWSAATLAVGGVLALCQPALARD
jgi:predicted MFS family arabinose efflux permease